MYRIEVPSSMWIYCVVVVIDGSLLSWPPLPYCNFVELRTLIHSVEASSRQPPPDITSSCWWWYTQSTHRLLVGMWRLSLFRGGHNRYAHYMHWVHVRWFPNSFFYPSDVCINKRFKRRRDDAAAKINAERLQRPPSSKMDPKEMGTLMKSPLFKWFHLL